MSSVNCSVAALHSSSYFDLNKVCFCLYSKIRSRFRQRSSSGPSFGNVDPGQELAAALRQARDDVSPILLLRPRKFLLRATLSAHQTFAWPLRAPVTGSLTVLPDSCSAQGHTILTSQSLLWETLHFSLEQVYLANTLIYKITTLIYRMFQDGPRPQAFFQAPLGWTH